MLKVVQAELLLLLLLLLLLWMDPGSSDAGGRPSINQNPGNHVC
jgi:hypothetical protein